MTREEQQALHAIRARWKVAHVEGSGRRTFLEHAVEDVGALLALVDGFEGKEYERRLDDLRRALAEAESEADRVRERAERREAAEKVARVLVDAAISKLREVFP